MVHEVLPGADASALPWQQRCDLPLNEVRLVGRISGVPENRELPSGDTVVTWRLVVPRDPARGSGVDTIDCAAWGARHRKRALGLPDGACVAVEGQLRRRFWRASGGPASRYEVEVTGLVRRRDLEKVT